MADDYFNPPPRKRWLRPAEFAAERLFPSQTPQGERIGWDRLDPDLKRKVEDFPSTVGYTPTITSGYRTPEEQRRLPTRQKAPDSLHTEGRALDQRIKGLSRPQITAALEYYNSDPEYRAWTHTGTAPHLHVEKRTPTRQPEPAKETAKVQPSPPEPKSSIFGRIGTSLKEGLKDTLDAPKTVARAANAALAGILTPLAQAEEAVLPKSGPLARAPGTKPTEIIQQLANQPRTELEKKLGLDVTQGIPYGEAEKAVVRKSLKAAGVDPKGTPGKIVQGVVDPVLETASGLTAPANMALLASGPAAGAAFLPGMTAGVVEGTKEAYKGFKEGDPYRASKGLMQAVIGGSGAAMITRGLSAPSSTAFSEAAKTPPKPPSGISTLDELGLLKEAKVTDKALQKALTRNPSLIQKELSNITEAFKQGSIERLEAVGRVKETVNPPKLGPRQPGVRLTHDVEVTDTYGQKLTLPQGEEYSAFRLPGKKIRLQDGYQADVDITQYKALMNQGIKVGPGGDAPIGGAKIPEMREKGFITRMKESPEIPPETKARLKGEYETYPGILKETQERWQKIVEKDPEAARRVIMLPDDTPTGRFDRGAATKALIQKYTREGQYEKAAEIIEYGGDRAHEFGSGLKGFDFLADGGPEAAVFIAGRKVRQAAKPELHQKLAPTAEKITAELNRVNQEALPTVVKEISEEISKPPVPVKKPSTGKTETGKPPILAELAPKELRPPKSAAQLLAEKIKVEKKTLPKEQHPLRDMIETLYQIAKEELPPTERTKVPSDPIKFIGQAIENRGRFGEVFEAAKEVLKKRYADKPEALARLKDLFEREITVPAYAERQLSQAVKDYLTTNKINLGQLVRDFYTKVEETRKGLTNYLVEKTGVSVGNARELAELIQAKFNRLTKDRKDQIIKSELRETKPSRTQRLLTDKMIEWSNLGALDTATYRTLVAKKLGVPALSPETARLITEKAREIQSIPADQPYARFVETTELARLILRDAPKSKAAKIRDFMVDLANIPRSVAASFDFSFALNQGYFAALRHPVEAFRAVKRSIPTAFRQRRYSDIMNEVMSHPDFEFAKASGVPFSDITLRLLGREDRFMSSLAERIPVIGALIRGSNRAYTANANKLRMDLFAKYKKLAETLGLDLHQNPTLAKQLGSWIGDLTGRSDLPSYLRGAAPLLNAFFFSPRLLWSRLKFLNAIHYLNQEPMVRREYLKTILAYTTFLGLTYSLGNLIPGVSVSRDFRNADLFKLRIRNTRLNLSSNMQSYIRFLGQFISGKYVSSATGKVITLGEGYNPLTRPEIAGRFLQSKENPVLGLIVDLMRGEDEAGRPLTVSSVIANRVAFMTLSDLYDLAKSDPWLLPLGVLSAFGAGLQTYGPPPAYEAWHKIKASPDPIQAYRDLKKQDPALASKVRMAARQETFTEFDWDLTYMKVMDGTRAKFLYEHLSKQPTDKRIEMYRDLRQKRLITDEVAEQLQVLDRYYKTQTPTDDESR